MKKSYRYVIILIVSLLFLIPDSYSQIWKLRRYEMEGGFGMTNYFGDIGGYSNGDNVLGLKDLSAKSISGIFNIGMRYKMLEKTWLKFNLGFGSLRGSDQGGTNDERGIKFNTFLFEPSLRLEQAIISGKDERSYLMMKGRGISSFRNSFSLYLFGGIGGALVSPKPKEDPYDRMTNGKSAIIFPLGVGMKLALDPNWSVGADMGWRFSTSDYLDGFSSQYSDHNDVYFLLNVSLIWKLRTSRRNLPVFRF